MTETRVHFHDELNALEGDVLTIGDMAADMLSRASGALAASDERLADAVIAADDALDDGYLAIDRRVLELIARQTPVAGDLRLILAILHISLHLERIGDTAVTIAKIIKATQGLPRADRIVAHLTDMSEIVIRMVRTASDAFARRDLELAMQVPLMDDPVDQLNRGIYEQVSACSADPQLLEWAMRMIVVSRQLERAGDHAVDIAEQVAFLLTGEFREFTDASHPVSG